MGELVELYDKKAAMLNTDEKDSKESNVKKNNLSDVTTPTSNYTTTAYYTLQSWGGFFPKIKIHIEQLTRNYFLCNHNGAYSIEQVQTRVLKEDNKKKTEVFLQVGDKEFLFPKGNHPIKANMHYHVPPFWKAKEFIEGKFKPRPYKKINEDIVNALKLLYDFKFDMDIPISCLHIGQSRLTPILNNFFFIGIDASFGAGKTTLLEIFTRLKRHGFMGGDISAAAIPRLVDELALNVSLDELDQRLQKGEADSVSILRKGQRKGNPYVRCEGKNFTPKSYEVAGAHDYSFRSETEDAFASRSLKIHTAVSTDNKLPVLNIFKKQILQSLADELYFWDISNLLQLQAKYEQMCSRCSSVVGCSSGSRTKEKRTELFNRLTSHLPEGSLKLLNKLVGRNTELCFGALNVMELLDLDILNNLKEIFESKQQDEETSENFYKEYLFQFLFELITEGDENGSVPVLKDGKNAGCQYYPKNLAFERFTKKISDLKVATIGTKRFTSLLKDIGFVQNISITSQRYEGKPPRHCLIFIDEIRNKLLSNKENSLSAEYNELQTSLNGECSKCKKSGLLEFRDQSHQNLFCRCVLEEVVL